MRWFAVYFLPAESRMWSYHQCVDVIVANKATAIHKLCRLFNSGWKGLSPNTSVLMGFHTEVTLINNLFLHDSYFEKHLSFVRKGTSCHILGFLGYFIHSKEISRVYFLPRLCLVLSPIPPSLELGDLEG